MFAEYNIIFNFAFFCILIVGILFFGSFFAVYQKPDFEKLSSYECGFNPHGDARVKFEIHFYLVALLFMIFDLEITYLFPWCLAFVNLTFYASVVMAIFILVLTLGFIFELATGALDWK